jgi:hypothetical protein
MAYYKNYKPKNKYGNIKQEYDGRRYDSKKEASKAFELNMMLKKGIIKGWEAQRKIPINAYYKDGVPILTDMDGLKLKEAGLEFFHICNYYIDFVVFHNDGSVEYLEIKSPITMTDVWKLKWKCCECIFAEHPTIFMNVEV